MGRRRCRSCWWAEDPVLGALMAQNLRRHGFAVQEADRDTSAPTSPPSTAHQALSAACAPSAPMCVLVCELSEPEPACWAAACVQAVYGPAAPLILLCDAWPDGRRLSQLEPCHYLRKLVAIGDRVRAVYCAGQRARLPVRATPQR